MKDFKFKSIIVLILCLFTVLSFNSCTNNLRTRNYGGNTVIRLPAGQKLVEVTWKGVDLWYLVEPMEENYTPKTKLFIEDSRFGIMEGSVTFIETR